MQNKLKETLKGNDEKEILEMLAKASLIA